MHKNIPKKTCLYTIHNNIEFDLQDCIFLSRFMTYRLYCALFDILISYNSVKYEVSKNHIV